MPPFVAVHCLLLMVGLLLSGMNCFTICSYNVPDYTTAKSSNPRVLNTLTRICGRCDISMLMGVKDPAAVKPLLAALNRYSESESGRYSKKFKYKCETSKALGTNSKNMEHYTFCYRTQTVNLTGQYQYQSSGFVRPPLAMRFGSSKTAIREFVLIPLHSEPSKAVQEMDKLYDVFLEVIRKWSNKNVMFLGDFHASCGYMSRTDKKKIRLFSNTSFSWLIPDREDTTLTKDKHCAFDRMVVYGKSFLKQIKPFSAKVFNPMKKLHLRSSQVVEVSDHFPIVVELKSSVTSLLPVSSVYFLLILHSLYLTL